MEWLYLIFAALFATWFYYATRKPKNFPPGPPRLPLVGSFPYVNGSGEKPSLILGISDLMKQHGPIIGFYYGKTPAVFLTDYNTIKTAFKSDILASRPDFKPFGDSQPMCDEVRHKMHGRVQGVMFSSGTYWKELRAFLVKNLKEFGFGKTSMEDLFLEEVAKLCHFLEKSSGQPVDLSTSTNISVINSLWSILTGEKFELEDKRLKNVVDEINNFFRDATLMSPVIAILPSPEMAKWPILNRLTGQKSTKEALTALGDLVIPYIKEHEATLDSQNIRDFLDLMILEHKKSTNSDSCFTGELGKGAIVNTMIDLFIGGMQTTVISLLMAILHLLHHPTAQDKIQAEIDEVTNKSRFPSFHDSKQMPYTNACMQESFRVGSIAYMSVPHSASEEFNIGSYTIPKGAIVISSLYHAMHDPKLFKDPDVFRPERYIDENGKFIYDEHVITFGLGKRICIGQSLEEKQFFFFFTGLLQQFKISLAPGETLPSYIDIFPPPEVLLRVAPPFKVVLTKRKL